MSVAAVGDPPARMPATDILLRAAAAPDARGRMHELLGPFCHEYRNHLNVLRMSLYLAERSTTLAHDPRWREQAAHYRALEEALERLHQICRPLHLNPVRLPIALLWDEAVPQWADACARRGIDFRACPSARPVVGDFDPHHLRRGLDAFVQWRAAAAPVGSTACFSWRAEGECFWVEWRESSLDPTDIELADDPSDLFALPFLARVLAAHRGTVDVETRCAYGVVLRWPLEIHAHE